MAQPLTLDDLVMEAIVTQLQDKLDTGVTDPDTVHAALVKVGNLQEDPTDLETNITIHPAREEWASELETNTSRLPALGFVFETGDEIQVSAWRRRYVIEFQLYFDNELDRDVARRKAMSILKRTHVAVLGMEMRNIPMDVYGEKAHMVNVAKSWLKESGGDGTYIWRGQMMVEFLTTFEPNFSAL